MCAHVSVSFPVAVIKCADKTNLGVKGFISAHSSRFQSMIARMSQVEGAWRIWLHNFLIEKWRTMVACMLVFTWLSPLLESRIPLPREWCHPQWLSLPSSMTIIKISHIPFDLECPSLRLHFWVVLDFVMLAIILIITLKFQNYHCWTQEWCPCFWNWS